MCDATFTFGQRGSHFFQCPSHHEATRLPPKLTTLIHSPNLSQIHHLALGTQDSFLLTWRDSSGTDRISTAGLPEELTAFLHARTRNIPLIRCILGPYNASFFVHDSSAYLWMSIPRALLAALESRIKNGGWTDRPRVVALGADGDFVLITEGGTAVWECSRYKSVAGVLEAARRRGGKGVGDVRGVVLHPYRYGCFVVVEGKGEVRWENVPVHQVAGMQGMVEPVLRDSQRKMVLPRRESERKGEAPTTVQRRSSTPLQERARVKREWSGSGEGRRHYTATAQSKGLKLSLSLSIGGLARMLG